MEAKIEKMSELSKLLSAKTRMRDNFFHLFDKFSISKLTIYMNCKLRDLELIKEP